MKFLQGLSLFASVATAVSIDLSKRDSPLDVKIQMVDNSIVEATITNTGSETLRLFKAGTILDSAAVEKTDIFSGGRLLLTSYFKPPSNPLQPTRSPLTASACASAPPTSTPPPSRLSQPARPSPKPGT